MIKLKIGKIKIDDRESNFIFNGFKKEDIEYEKVRLDVGDIQYENVCIEHKTVEDFVQSFRSGRLIKQLLQQEQNFKHSFLIISGDFNRLFFNPHMKGCGSQQIIGMIVSISCRFNKTKILQTVNFARAFKMTENKLIAQICKKLCEKCDDGKVTTIRDTELLKNTMSVDDMKLKLLTCFYGVGIVKAKKILPDRNIQWLLDELIKSIEFELMPKKKQEQMKKECKEAVDKHFEEMKNEKRN